MSDNFHFDLTGVPLDKCLEIACSSSRKIVGYRVQTESDDTFRGREWEPRTKAGRFILFWAEGAKDMVHLPAKMDQEQIIPLIKAWLSEADYGREPDHDGDNGKGWRVYNEAWGHVNGEWQAFCAIEPVWLMYGK